MTDWQDILTSVESASEYAALVKEPHREYAAFMAEATSIDDLGQRWSKRRYTLAYSVEDAIFHDLRTILANERLHYSRLGRHYRQQERRVERANETRQITRNHKVRDSQRQKVYDAEQVIRRKGRTFTSVEEMQGYIDHLMGSAWFRRRWSIKNVTVKRGREGTSAWANGLRRLINMPTWAWTEDVLLHELSHILTDTHEGKVAPHGREFARIYLELVRHKMGKEHGDALRDSFRQHRVKFTKPRAPMTPEQREAAAERLAAARQAKGAK